MDEFLSSVHSQCSFLIRISLFFSSSSERLLQVYAIELEASETDTSKADAAEPEIVS
jgi:hypothetical protein